MRVSQRRYSSSCRESDGASGTPSAAGGVIASALLAAAALGACSTTTSPPEPVAAVATSEALDQLPARATAALETNRAAQAKQLYGTILAGAPNDPEAWAGLCEAEVLLGAYPDALEHCREAVELAGERADLKGRARRNAGVALLLTDRPQEAEQELEIAVELDPKSWRAWNALGRARDARQAWEEARVAYERALTLAPREAAVLNNFGMSKLSAGDPEGAAALFVRALEASPDLAVAETNLRVALALDGRYEEAVVGVAPEEMPAVLNNAGYAALLRGDYPQARILFLRAIEASPGFYEPAWSNLQFLGAVEQRQAAAPKAP
jgi:Tfp pilus assembly protein PilF